MTPYFAYGSNMSRTRMGRRCRHATAIGPARLEGWRFLVTRDGYASVVPAPGAVVHGVLWRVSARDLAALNAYESLDSGLYVRRTLPVRAGDRIVAALVYVGRESKPGKPRPGYQRALVAAAREWGLPDRYVQSLERWGQPFGTRAAEVGEAG
ncbi:MAG: gamma-glutamylcyclotransferase [Alphaproteobacteria bacterium]|nr:MAG: gamma-glutamylcyclotransferase [Alphaproteobacteria bacterium]